MTYDNIFSSFIWKTKLDYEGKNNLIERIEENYLRSPDKTPSKWKCNVHSTFDDQSSHIPTDLITLFENKANEFLESYDQNLKLTGNFYIIECWYNAYKGHQFQEPHDHGTNLISGCYYLKFNKNKHHQTEFYNPNYKVNFHNLESNPHFCYTPDCDEGDLIIFPSNLKHGTKGIKNKNKCDELRITISFNVVNDNICFEKDKKYLNTLNYQ